MIDEILEHELAGAAVAYFYFDFGEQKTQTPLYLVGSIVRQLALQAKVFPPPLLHFFTRFKENEAHGSTNELVIILRNICATFKKCYVIIDALDECQKDYRKEILKILNDLCTGKVQLFVTSRPHSQDIKQHFRGTEHIKVEAREADIKSYCLQLIDDHEEIEDLVNDELKFEIAETISKSAQGM